MKWARKYWHRFFALIPHKCRRCDFTYWLEPMWIWENDYGDVHYYCRKCKEKE